jgi:hypothetical protein
MAPLASIGCLARLAVGLACERLSPACRQKRQSRCPVNGSPEVPRGAPHGFQNVGDTPAAALEIFVKDGASAAKIQARGVTPGALAKP